MVDIGTDGTHLRAALAQVVGLPVGLRLLRGLRHSGVGLLLLLLLGPDSIALIFSVPFLKLLTVPFSVPFLKLLTVF